MQKLSAYIRAAGVVLTLSLPVAATAESLADTLVSAYKNSNLLEQNRALLRSVDEDVARTVAALRPIVNFLSRTTYTRPTFGNNIDHQLSLTARLDVLTFGRNRSAIAAAKEQVLAARQGLRQVEQNVLLTAVQAYSEVRRARQVLDLRRRNVELIAREVQAAEDRFGVGEVTRTDVALTQSRLANARANLAVARGDLDVARERFNAAVGRYPGNLAPVSRRPSLASSEEEAKSVSRRSHPLLLQLQKEVSASEINVQLAINDMKPTVSIAGRVDWDARSENTDELYSLDATVPLYQGGRLSALHRRAVAIRDATRAELLQTTLEIERSVGTAWADVLVSRARLSATDEQIRAAQMAFDGVREEARVGARTTFEVLDREQELNDARTDRINAEADEIIATYGLLSSMGLLTVDHLGLAVPTYDPEAYYNAVRQAPGTSDRQQALDRVFKSIGRTYD